MAESAELLIRDVYPGPPGPHSTGSDVIWVTSNLFYTTTDTVDKIKRLTMRIIQREAGTGLPFSPESKCSRLVPCLMCNLFVYEITTRIRKITS